MAEYTREDLDRMAKDLVKGAKVLAPGAKLNHWYIQVGEKGTSLVALVDLPNGTQSREYCAL